MRAAVTPADLHVLENHFGSDGWLSESISTPAVRATMRAMADRGLVVLDKHPQSPTDGRKPLFVWRVTDAGRRLSPRQT